MCLAVGPEPHTRYASGCICTSLYSALLGGLVSPWSPGKSGRGILCTSPVCNRAFPHFDLFRLDLLCTLLYPPFPLISLRLFYNYARPHTLETKMEVFKKPREWVLSPSSCAMACPVASVIGPEPR